MVCFAGDALICVFRSLNEGKTVKTESVNTEIPGLGLGGGVGSSGSQVKTETLPQKVVDFSDENYCLRALQCACELRKRENKHLACHIAVTVGEIKLGILGGYHDEWAYIIK